MRLQLRDLGKPHAELNWWHPTDFTMLLGSAGLSYSHILDVREYANAGYDDSRFTEEKAWELIGRMHRDTAFGAPYGRGILVVKRQADAETVCRVDESDLLRQAASTKLPLDYLPYPEPEMVPDNLASRLRCPLSRSDLKKVDGGLYCEASGCLFPVSRGIPNMIPARAPDSENPTNVVRHFTMLFGTDQIARTPLSRSMYSAAIKCMERTRSLRARRSRPTALHE